jgi:hypothetical protein
VLEEYASLSDNKDNKKNAATLEKDRKLAAKDR